MKPTRVHFTDAAVNDILEQADWYEQRLGEGLASRWESAVTWAVRRIARNPHSGALCSFRALELQSIRRMPIAKFPKHLIFYQIGGGGIVILRVVHGSRDLESLF